jgi:flagellar M-ring protein FliF
VAGPNLQAIGQDAVGAIQRMSGAQRATLGLAFFATMIGLFLVATTTGGTPMSTLFGGLEPSTAAEVTAELDAQGVPYNLMDGGQVIQVPSDQVHSLRLAMAAQDLPGTANGWNILDNQGITATVFQQQIGFQRAMEGELARTISVIDGVSSANVHLAIPEDDLIVSDNKHPSASVLLVTNGGGTISPMQVDAIVNLVASSIEGLTPDQVAVTDQSGLVLASPGGGSGAIGLEGATRLSASQGFEQQMENDLEQMLAVIVGPGRAIVNVTAELDFDSVMTTTESRTAVLSEEGQQLLESDTTRDELYDGDGSLADEEGQLEIEFPDEELEDEADADAGTGGVDYELNEADSRYLYDTTVTNAESAAGAVTSLSVAVLLDQGAIDANTAGEIEGMVEAAAGIRDARGDALAVTLLPFDEEVLASIDAANSVELLTEGQAAGGGLDLISLIRTVGTVIVVLVVIMLGLRMSKGPKRKVVESVDLAEVEAGSDTPELEAGEEASDEDAEDAEAEPEPEPEPELDENGNPPDPPEIVLNSLIANQTEDVADVLRTWLNEAEEVAR